MFYELTLFMTYFNQRCVNVFNYVLTGTPASVSGAFGLVEAFGAVDTAGVFPLTKPFQLLRDCVSTSVIFNQIRVKNPYDPVDFYSLPFASGVAGGAPGTPVSPTVAYGLHSNQVRLDIRAGQKRLVGVSETYVDAGGVVTAPMIATLDLLAEALSNPITFDDEGNTLTYNLAVASKYSDPEAVPPVVNAYWPTAAEQITHSALGTLWTPFAETRTQTSRQYGKGR